MWVIMLPQQAQGKIAQLFSAFRKVKRPDNHVLLPNGNALISGFRSVGLR
jgi:hypothetical protein